jgi:hypothetical protein
MVEVTENAEISGNSSSIPAKDQNLSPPEQTRLSENDWRGMGLEMANDDESLPAIDPAHSPGEISSITAGPDDECMDVDI